MNVWELKPERLTSLWLTTLQTWGGITLAKGLRDRGWRALPILNYTLTFALQLRTARKTSDRVAKWLDHSLR